MTSDKLPLTDPNSPLPLDLQQYKNSYVQLFGEMPPLPDAKFAFAAQIDPEGLAQLEAVRAHAFASSLLDPKTIQLICFAVLLAQGIPAASEHARAARRTGATWEELWLVCELTAAVQSSGPVNQGGSILQKLRLSEKTPEADKPS